MDNLRMALQEVGTVDPETIQERPWGIWADWYRTPSATLKCMVVKPGARMSLQKHQHRSEVWRVMSGEGEDQGTTPPTPLVAGRTHIVQKGATHRAANTGSVPLVIIEMQLGHCDENDIERLADDYSRHA